jgi:hypothetical protein
LGFALVVVVLGLVYLYVGEPVRAIKLTEIAAGISAVAMGIVLGTLVGAYVQIRGAVAVVLLGFALVQVGTNPDIGVLGLEGAGPLLTRLAPVQIPSQFLPIDIIDRNGVEHIAVILGVGGLAWGITHLTRRFRWIPGTVTLISIGLIAGNWGSSLPTTPGGAELAAYYASPRECTHVRTVEVCSFEGYESWRGRWAAELLQPPLAAWNRAVRIEQVALGDDSSPAAIAAAEAGVLSVPLSFDRTGRSGRHTSALRLQAALGAVGLPETVYDRGGGCFAGSQARAVVALWLAGAGSSNQVVSQWLTSALASTGDLFWIGVEPAQTRVTRADADLALEMLKSEEQHQIETVTWDERSSILRGRMTTEDLATELGLAVASITFQDDVGTTCD